MKTRRDFIKSAAILPLIGLPIVNTTESVKDRISDKELIQAWMSRPRTNDIIENIFDLQSLPHPIQSQQNYWQSQLEYYQSDWDALFKCFELVKIPEGTASEFPMDLLPPGNQAKNMAYTHPGNDKLVERHVEGNYVCVPYCPIKLRHDNETALHCERFKIESRMMGEVLCAAATDRNIMIHDIDAITNHLTTRLLSVMKIIMRRHGSESNTKMTHLLISSDAHNNTQRLSTFWVHDGPTPPTTRNANGTVDTVNGVKLVPLNMLNHGGHLHSFYSDRLLGSIPGDKKEICIGLNLSWDNTYKFVIPERSSALLRYCGGNFEFELERGYAVLNNQSILLGAF